MICGKSWTTRKTFAFTGRWQQFGARFRLSPKELEKDGSTYLRLNSDKFCGNVLIDDVQVVPKGDVIPGQRRSGGSPRRCAVGLALLLLPERAMHCGVEPGRATVDPKPHSRQTARLRGPGTVDPADPGAALRCENPLQMRLRSQPARPRPQVADPAQTPGLSRVERDGVPDYRTVGNPAGRHDPVPLPL
ncbi:MAG: hypothetical protein L6W00_16635 [Lentisphaeria bacterium]|nr:MAG: hypothetical protein L6W00_16635 [Lentisphaeria bacterium]